MERVDKLRERRELKRMFPHMDKTILLEIPAFQDPELLNTVYSALIQADVPDRIHFAVCFQDDDLAVLARLRGLKHMSVVRVKPKDAKGTCYARWLCQELYGGEDFVYHLDSHMRFIKHWDTALIRQWHMCGDPMAGIAFYPAALTDEQLTMKLDDPAFDFPRSGTRIHVEHIDPDSGQIRFGSEFYPDTCEKICGRTPFVSGANTFLPGRASVEVRMDPNMWWQGDEFAYGIRLFTYGYNIYTASKGYVLHKYLRSGRAIPSSNGRCADELRRLKALLGMLDGVDLGEFGPGNVRTVEEYRVFSGIDFNMHSFDSRARSGCYSLGPSVPELPRVPLERSVPAAGGCYGCGACVNACPLGAVSLAPDANGFLSPVTDEKKCSGCMKCARVCPRLSPSYSNIVPAKCMAVMAEDDVRARSSSGGVFTLLSRHVLKQSGLVFGAGVSDDMLVRHMCVETERDLSRIRGSKYAQSDTGHTFSDTKSALDAGRIVLYCGCPCQIAGLRAFLGCDYDNLVTVDLVCCGTPSSYSLKQYIADTWGDGNASGFRFRDMSGWGYRFDAFLKSGDVAPDPAGSYMKLYLQHALNKPACDTCQFDMLPRQGDFTIGDFWNVGSLDSTMDDRKGTSIVLCNNAKARRFWDDVTGVKRSREFTIEQAYNSGVAFLRHGPVPYKRRAEFRDLCRENGFTAAVDIEANHFNVGIAGTWLANYGTISTNWALYNVIRSFGLSACVLDVTGNAQIDGDAGIPNAFLSAKRIPRASQFCCNGDYQALNRYCDMFVTASDQLWGYFLPYTDHPEYVHLGFADDGKRLVAAGTAIGSRTVRFEGHDRDARRKWLSRFSYIGVREDFGPEVLREIYGVNAEHMQDPVFLCDKSLFLNETKNATFSPSGQFVFAYLIYKDMDSLEFALAKDLARRLHIGLIVSFGTRSKILEYAPDMTFVGEHEPYYRNWLRCMAGASFVLTSSFHGACLSIIFEKDFVATGYQGAERMDSLGRDFHCESRFVANAAYADACVVLSEHVDYKVVSALVRHERERCVAALKHAIMD